MNWYKISSTSKTARRSKGEYYTNQRVDDIFREVIKYDKSARILEIRKDQDDFLRRSPGLDIKDLVGVVGELSLEGIPDLDVEKIELKTTITAEQGNAVQVSGEIGLGDQAMIAYHMLDKNEAGWEKKIPSVFIIRLTIILPGDFSKKHYKELYFELAMTLRYEINHVLDGMEKQMNSAHNKVRAKEPIDEYINYFLSPGEIDTFVTGFYAQAKKEKKTVQDCMMRYLTRIGNNMMQNGIEETLSFNTVKRIRDVWIDHARKRFPNVEKQLELV